MMEGIIRFGVIRFVNGPPSPEYSNMIEGVREELKERLVARKPKVVLLLRKALHPQEAYELSKYIDADFGVIIDYPNVKYTIFFKFQK
jgi:hypothetical protein